MREAPDFPDLTCAKCDGEGANLTAAGVIDCECTWGMRCPGCTRPVRLLVVESDRSPRSPVYATISCDSCQWRMVSPKTGAA